MSLLFLFASVTDVSKSNGLEIVSLRPGREKVQQLEETFDEFQAEPEFVERRSPPNFGGLVLGCIEAKLCK